MRHIENPGIVRTVYSGIFRHIQGHSAIFSHVQSYWGTLRHIKAYSGIIEAYRDILGTLRNPCIYNRAIFRTLAYLEPEASSKVCWTYKMFMHIHTHGIEQFIQGFSRMFRHIQDIGSDSATLTGVQLGRKGEVSPALFENRKKCPDCVHHWVKFSTQNVVLIVSRRKNVKMFSCGDSFIFCFDEMFIKVF